LFIFTIVTTSVSQISAKLQHYFDILHYFRKKIVPLHKFLICIDKNIIENA